MASPTKRVKAALGTKLNGALKSAPANQARTPKRVFGALLDVTNTRAQPSQAPQGSKGTFLKPTIKTTVVAKPRPILKPLSAKKSPAPKGSPTRTSSLRPRTRTTSPILGPARVFKRAYSPPSYKRVDPPKSSLRNSTTSIDGLLAGTFTREDSPDGGVMLPPASPRAPILSAEPILKDSWNFDIYEDSPDETLQNLMEHSTHTLDISDSSDNESSTSELAEWGKENIHPTRLAELLAYSPADRVNAMYLDSDSRIPQRKQSGGGPGGRFLREHRQALREMNSDELLCLKEVPVPEDNGVKLPTLEAKNFFEFATPEKTKCATPPAPSSPGWAIWESDHESNSDKEEVVVARPKKIFEDLDAVKKKKMVIFADVDSGAEN